MNKKIHVESKGTSPLLMHRFPMIPLEAPEKKSAAEQAEYAAYRHGENLYVPGLNLQRSLVSSALFSKGKGRSSLQKRVAACVLVSPEHLDLGTARYDIDSRPVVVPATKGRIIRHRPRLDEWKLKFDLEYDENLLGEPQVRRIVDDAGQLVGLLDFRPETKGSFGGFIVTFWEVE
jgi:hypothetical protein